MSNGTENTTGFLEERPGKKSVMRAMSVAALVASIVFASWVLSSNDPSTLGVYIVLAFLTAAFAPKALQKFAERHLSS